MLHLQNRARSARATLLVAAAFLQPSLAHAQADANPTAKADDAFGFQDGDEAVGIYDASSVRGFDLQAAGNYRFNGTYFVKNSGLSTLFLEGNSIRIGYGALGVILPGPSGVVDYRLRDPAPGERSIVTLDLQPYGTRYLEGAYRHGAADGRNSVSVGAATTINASNFQGGQGGYDFLVGGIVRRTRGPLNTRLFGHDYYFKTRGLYTVQAVDGQLPRPIDKRHYLGPDWAWDRVHKSVVGFLADYALSQSSGAGLTLSYGRNGRISSTVGILSPPSGAAGASYTQVLLPRQPSHSLSGELRAHKQWVFGRSQHRIDLVVRDRHSASRFGGGVAVALGDPFASRSSSDWDDEPDVVPAARLSTKVQQWGIGGTYRATLGSLRLNAGLLRSDYRKAFRSNAGVTTRSHSTPVQWNLSGAYRIADGIEAYGSYVKGFEEAGIAPTNAANPNEVLDAISVTQRELGVRLVLRKSVNLILGTFDTRKPYAGIDPASRIYRRLGEVRHRGLEFSLSGNPIDGLSLLAGGVLINPSLSGVEVEQGLLGRRPVGVPRLRTVTSINYQPAWAKKAAFDGSYEYVGRRAASSALGTNGQLQVPALGSLNVGGRYTFELGKMSAIVRVQVLNLLNERRWDVQSSDALLYTEPRRLRVVLTSRL